MLDTATHALRKKKWFTGRTALLMEKYGLSDNDACAIYAIFKVRITRWVG
jgi:hypothetical protein